MTGAEGLDAAFRDAVACGELVKLLVSIADFHGGRCQALAHSGHKIFFNGLFDKDDGSAESGLIGIINGVVQDGLSVAAQGINLLESAVTAAHPGSKDDENRFIHNRMLLSV